ncbi:dnaJ homolog subfamily C member 17 isoform X2 [Entelurus aequoreus]|uniref:dnaJ homolog subfamily C member 17 isoform X2 n=1 Tax=Entelurus aequoreus TaxID=161455 RepID=UPI002B1D208F|nr:dnaJ homolog subfamily C member 17 isoform X2 [Entelurus aequoreus]
MSEKAKDILKMDLYGLLGIENTATTKEIKKAYRQKALKCHPDKNPDNPKAAELFHQLSQALEVLTDAPAKAAYDKICAAKKQAEERNRKLDDKRKKIKLDLETRERQAEAETQVEVQITRTLEEEIARLREEGSRQLEEEQRLISEQIQREREAQQNTGSGVERCSRTNVTPKLKYGDVLNVIISSKKRGSAVVEYATVKAAELAVKNESGLSENPLKISWLEGQPEVASASEFMSAQIINHASHLDRRSLSRYSDKLGHFDSHSGPENGQKDTKRCLVLPAPLPRFFVRIMRHSLPKWEYMNIVALGILMTADLARALYPMSATMKVW